MDQQHQLPSTDGDSPSEHNGGEGDVRSRSRRSISPRKQSNGASGVGDSGSKEFSDAGQEADVSLKRRRDSGDDEAGGDGSRSLDDKESHRRDRRESSSSQNALGQRGVAQTAEDSKSTSKPSDAEARSGSEAKRPRFDHELKRSGQRMFGFALGTLKKAAAAEKTEAQLKREELEKRLQEKLQQQKQEVAEKVRQDMEVRRAKIQALRQEEDERRAALIKVVLKNQTENLSHFISTKTEPPVFFVPAKTNYRIDAKIKESRAAAEELRKRESPEAETTKEELKSLPPPESKDPGYDGMHLDDETEAVDAIE
ncbi:pinin/SDK/memA/ protein conserved region-domain-containing protein [Zopfochytrium polystomum]|nr:pinin/SDK/memA/ protein conserved region-domain-containing protein [Zopfochytrium polystomum]